MLSQKRHKGEGKAQDGVALVGGRHVLSISLVNVSATTSNGVPMKKRRAASLRPHTAMFRSLWFAPSLSWYRVILPHPKLFHWRSGRTQMSGLGGYLSLRSRSRYLKRSGPYKWKLDSQKPFPNAEVQAIPAVGSDLSLLLLVLHPDPICSLCNAHPKTTEHLFLLRERVGWDVALGCMKNSK